MYRLDMADIGASILDLAVRGYLPTMFAIDLQDMPHGPQRNELVAPSSGGAAAEAGAMAGTAAPVGVAQGRRTPGGTYYPTSGGSDTGLPVSFACCARPKAKQSTAQTPATGTVAAATAANVRPIAANMLSTPAPARSPPR